MRENAAAKARRLLVEGRVDVERRIGREVLASVRGDSGELYLVEHHAGSWACSCPALGRCSHVQAIQLVTVVVRPAGELGGA